MGSSNYAGDPTINPQSIDSPNYANVPALAPPPGVVPNFNKPPSRAYEMRIGIGVCIAISSIFLVLRLYVKLAITHAAGWDDCKFLREGRFPER